MSKFGNEIVTIQLGHIPNFIGAHYFNIQNAGFSFNPDFPTDITHDILFKEGTSDNDTFTYTPRLISVDFEQSLYTLSRCGKNFTKVPTTDEVREVLGNHTTKVEVCQVGPTPEKNEYFDDLDKQAKSQNSANAMDVDLILKTKYDLTNTIRSWPELLTINLHHRSITTIPKTLTNGLEVSKTTSKFGEEIWKNPLFVDEFEDNLRYQLEACDNLQGFHLLCECDNLYSGINNGCLEYLRDECGKKTILSIPIFNLYRCEEDLIENRKRLCSNLINTAFSFSKSNELSDLVAPFSVLKDLWTEIQDFRSFSNLMFDGSSIYHSSAMMAACLELISTPYRLRRLPDARMSHIAALLNLPGRKYVGAGIIFPFPDRQINCDILELLNHHRYSSLCPLVPLENTLDTQAVTLRGFPHGQFPSSPALFVSSSNVRIPRTFPDIISPEHDLSNSAVYYGRMREANGLSGLCNSREMKSLMDKLVEQLKSQNLHKIPNFISNNLEKPEYDEILETLMDISSSYDIAMFL